MRTGQGRPRDAAIDVRVTDAVLRLLANRPYRDLTMEAVATEAATSKPALRRRWRSLPGIIVHTLIMTLGTTPTPNTGCVQCDLITGIGNLADTFAGSPLTSSLPGLIADLEGDTELRASFHRDYFEARRATTRAVIAAAIDRGEIDPSIDMELTLDMLAAPLYYRAFFGHQPITRDVAERTVMTVLRGIAAPGWTGHRHQRQRPAAGS